MTDAASWPRVPAPATGSIPPAVWPVRLQKSLEFRPKTKNFQYYGVMAGLVPAIHVLHEVERFVDARDKPGHDENIRDAQ
jgi:hypothetical protein